MTVWSWGRAEGLPSEVVLSVAIDGDRLWIGTAAGLALANGDGVIRVWDAADGLVDPWVYAVAPDGAGGAWVGTDRGLGRIDAAGGLTLIAEDAPVLSLVVTPEGQGYARRGPIRHGADVVAQVVGEAKVGHGKLLEIESDASKGG